MKVLGRPPSFPRPSAVVGVEVVRECDRHVCMLHEVSWVSCTRDRVVVGGNSRKEG